MYLNLILLAQPEYIMLLGTLSVRSCGCSWKLLLACHCLHAFGHCLNKICSGLFAMNSSFLRLIFTLVKFAIKFHGATHSSVFTDRFISAKALLAIFY